jgi:hypothetical protein
MLVQEDFRQRAQVEWHRAFHCRHPLRQRSVRMQAATLARRCLEFDPLFHFGDRCIDEVHRFAAMTALVRRRRLSKSRAIFNCSSAARIFGWSSALATCPMAKAASVAKATRVSLEFFMSPRLTVNSPPNASTERAKLR